MRTIPFKDAEFNIAADTIITAAYSNRENWNLDSEWMDAIAAKLNTWKDKYQTYLPIVERTSLMTFEKNEARKAVETLLRQLVKNLQSNPKVTVDELRAIGVVLPSGSRTPSPVPVTYPDFDVDTSVIRRLSINFRDHGKRSSAKPAGVHGVEIRWAILAEPTVDVSDLVHSSFDTRSPFTLSFEGNQRGKTAYFCLCWENTRGEKGPWSEIVSAIIP